ncbi:MAG: metallophosphoesterase, partial [Holdemanella sp.]|nr:metallophosphoesterase [Holdemanella sp.]
FLGIFDIPFLGIKSLLALPFYFIPGILIFLRYRKNCQKINYETNVCLDSKVKSYFSILLDRHKKRALNSIFILGCAIIAFVSRTLERALLSGMNQNELFVLLWNNVIILIIGLMFVIKNYLDVNYLLNYVPAKDKKDFFQFACKQIGAFSLTLIVLFGITALSGYILKNPYLVLYLLFTPALIILAWITFKKRKSFVQKNLVINKTSIAFGVVVALAFVTVNQFQKDVYVLQPYIMSTSAIEHNQSVINYDKKTGIYTMEAKDDFKILHLTDIHLGGSNWSAYKDYKALEACRKLITYTEPDLVVITGDMVFPLGIMSLSLNNQAPVIQFASFMRNIGIPWAFTYGNHDTEAMATGSRDEIDSLYKSLSYQTSGTLLYPYIKPDITGRCNQQIHIVNEDGSVREALFLIDSNDYIAGGINEYDYIHDDQVEWYASQVKEVKAPSMIFTHIPLQQYRTAYELYEKGSDEVTYYFGENGEEMIDKVCCSKYASQLFDTALQLGSTKAIFCGHDHYNNMSLEYKGIRLTYGMSIDYLAMPKIDQDTKQRGGELITIYKDASFDIKQIPLTSIE